jgi:hypothetical protein
MSIRAPIILDKESHSNLDVADIDEDVLKSGAMFKVFMYKHYISALFNLQ